MIALRKGYVPAQHGAWAMRLRRTRLCSSRSLFCSRAVWSPRTKLSVKRSGMLEIAYSALIFCSVLWLY
jgi:hypothetical protein